MDEMIAQYLQRQAKKNKKPTLNKRFIGNMVRNTTSWNTAVAERSASNLSSSKRRRSESSFERSNYDSGRSNYSRASASDPADHYIPTRSKPISSTPNRTSSKSGVNNVLANDRLRARESESSVNDVLANDHLRARESESESGQTRTPPVDRRNTRKIERRKVLSKSNKLMDACKQSAVSCTLSSINRPGSSNFT